MDDFKVFTAGASYCLSMYLFSCIFFPNMYSLLIVDVNVIAEKGVSLFHMSCFVMFFFSVLHW